MTLFIFVFQSNDSVETEWAKAKPFEAIPGPKALTMFARFMPGGEKNAIFARKFCFDLLSFSVFVRSVRFFFSSEWDDLKRSIKL